MDIQPFGRGKPRVLSGSALTLIASLLPATCFASLGPAQEFSRSLSPNARVQEAFKTIEPSPAPASIATVSPIKATPTYRYVNPAFVTFGGGRVASVELPVSVFAPEELRTVHSFAAEPAPASEPAPAVIVASAFAAASQQQDEPQQKVDSSKIVNSLSEETEEMIALGTIAACLAFLGLSWRGRREERPFLG